MSNPFITPIQGEPDIRQTGIIKIKHSDTELYPIARLTYELFWNEEYQYIFEPFWDLIEQLPQGVWFGISGLDMDLHLPQYYRVNMVPCFMVQRTPDKNRQDVHELMKSVGLDYYDRFEFLLRTTMMCGNDNLIVERE